MRLNYEGGKYEENADCIGGDSRFGNGCCDGRKQAMFKRT